MIRRTCTLLLVIGVAVGVAGCGDDSGSATTTSTVPPVAASTTAGADTGTAAATTTVPATLLETPPPNPNQVQVTATGAYAIDVSGAGGYCNYFVPGTQSGLVYSVSADELGSSGWDLHVQGNSPDSVGVLLNTDGGSFANDATLGNGVINAQDDLHHTDFDLDLVSMSDQTVVVHISGSIDCP